ncbi:MFS transporter [Tepidimonas charontis]|uniref:Putative MFS-type transporter YcaD n=1 Tax=Tepidimonas charontis TaxID=2267262 RepID=A0A554XG79_9BURK|nr:MFS transporter [Tepidimonas charontis]TSE34835.1 putative MFS-type transporter YcaD [Tepidimonas charontis]
MSVSLPVRGLWAIFGATFFELVGYFMLTPWLVLRLTTLGAPTALIGLFAASAWVGILVVTPFASALTRALGRQRTLWLSGAVPVLAGLGYALPLPTEAALPLWFALKLLAGMASGLRWILAEALVAEFAPAHLRGRAVGLFETMVGATFVIGPALLAAVGPASSSAWMLAVGLMALGLLWLLAVPEPPPAADAHTAIVGWRGVWQALRAHPVIMAAGFCGGFFESGLTSILPLYGLALGLSAAAAALLVSASGLGSAALMLPAGWLADRLGRRSERRGGAAGARLRLMRVCAAITWLATLAIPWVAATPWLAWPVAFLWGGAGGCLYTLAMIDIGARERGVTLVNSTAVLVMAYTLGGVLAPSLAGAALQWAPRLGFAALLIGVASLCLVLLARARAGRRT